MLSKKQSALALIIALMFGFAYAMADDSWEAPTHARRFEHEHLLHHFNGDSPSTGTDELALWEAPGGVRHFLLSTIGPNYHTCDVQGPLQTAGPGELVFSKDGCKLSFRESQDGVELVVSEGWERLGACPKLFECGMFGVVLSGTFHPVADPGAAK